jgi:hypothetical protein
LALLSHPGIFTILHFYLTSTKILRAKKGEKHNASISNYSYMGIQDISLQAILFSRLHISRGIFPGSNAGFNMTCSTSMISRSYSALSSWSSPLSKAVLKPQTIKTGRISNLISSSQLAPQQRSSVPSARHSPSPLPLPSSPNHTTLYRDVSPLLQPNSQNAAVRHRQRTHVDDRLGRRIDLCCGRDGWWGGCIGRCLPSFYGWQAGCCCF